MEYIPARADSEATQDERGSAINPQSQIQIHGEKPLTCDAQTYSREGAERLSQKRLYSLDMVRGIIIAVMAWDHCNDFIGIPSPSHRSGPGEFWSGPATKYQDSIVVWSARFVSHICAPGFMFMMGYGMAMLVTSRIRRGWSVLRIMRHFFVRGLVLMFAERVNNVVMALFRIASTGKFPTVAKLFIGFIWVLNVLGEVMILVGCFVVPIVIFLRRSGKAGIVAAQLVLAGTIIANFFVSSYLIETAQGSSPGATSPWPRSSIAPNSFFQVLLRFFVYPGNLMNDGANSVPIAYVIFPWMGVACFGMSMGFAKADKPTFAQHLTGAISILFLVSFTLVRTCGDSFGNLIGLPVRLDPGSSVPFISFFTLSKYPPSLAFCLITLGIDIGLLYIFGTLAFSRFADAGRAASLLNPILTFGRVPFFFFCLHLWIVSAASGVVRSFSKGLSLPALVPVWLLLLVVLYPLCKWYNGFKSSTSENSLWRLF